MPCKITLHLGDITTMEVDAIVNSANNDLVLGGGVSGALRRLGGPVIQEECNKIGTIPLGEAVLTSGGNLKAKWVIHAATNPLGLWSDAKSVRNAARNIFKRAQERNIKSLAIPAIGTGAGGFPLDRCADVLLEETEAHVKGTSSLESVTFVLYEEKLYKMFEERFIRKMPEAWMAMTGQPLPELPPEPPPDPEELLPPPKPEPPRIQRPVPSGPRPRNDGASRPSGQSSPPGRRRRRNHHRGRDRGPTPPRPPGPGQPPARPSPPTPGPA